MGPLILTLQSSSREFPERINWLQVAADIKQAGMSYNCQAVEIGKVWSSYQRMLEPGLQPRYSDGAAMLNLHLKMCGIELTLARLRST